MPRYSGGCFCGAVRVEVDGEPIRIGVCHCLDCRKRQGAVFHTFGLFHAKDVKVTGETRAYQSKRFCPTCGSPVFDDWGDEIEVYAGCLDATSQLKPTYESWAIRREEWLPSFDVERRFDRNRE